MVMLLAVCCLSAAGEAPATTKPPDLGRPFRATIGAVDTVGGTTYDMQQLGPALRTLVSSAGRGIYVVWMYSHTLAGTILPDRNMRCNYYDRGSQSWKYSASEAFMGRGLDVFSTRSGYGGVDADTGGTPFFSCHADLGGQVRAQVARGCSGDHSDYSLTALQWPPIAVGQSGAVHILPLTASDLELTYCQMPPGYWPNWSSFLDSISPSPGYVTQNIAASKVSTKVSLVWERSDSGWAYRMQSTDDGSSWSRPERLVPPAAYGGDTVTVFHIASLFPFYDRHDRFHILANLAPKVGSALLVPAQIWHWCPDNSPEWSRIHVASCYPPHMRASIGLNSMYACRPSIGEGGDGRLYVAWEQFDSLNFEPITSRLRADIFYTRDSGDNGTSWQPATRITDQGSWSCRFPSAIDYFAGDTFRVSYMIDQQAGFTAWALPEGGATENPVVVHRLPVNAGIAGGGSANMSSIGLTITPNPLCRTSTISYCLGSTGSVTITLLDVTGRAVRQLPLGRQPAGCHAVNWDAISHGGRALPTGIYFCRIRAGNATESSPVSVIR
jgi:hypothetical protein